MQPVSGDFGGALSVLGLCRGLRHVGRGLDRQSSTTAEVSGNTQVAVNGVASIEHSFDEWVVGVEAARQRPLRVEIQRGTISVGLVGTPDRFTLSISGE